jgi:branched-chain amino acid transport system substrate-binding protein
MKKTLIFAFFIFLAIIAMYYIFFQKNLNNIASNKPSEIVIGYNADQSVSSVAGYGVSSRDGFEIAVDEINGSGGILGKKIRTVIMDDKGDKEISKKNMEQLIFQEKAIAIIGPANSANALNWIDLAEENEVTVIVPIATASEITTKFSNRPRNYIFRISSLDKEQARLLIAWAIKKTNNGRIAVIHDSAAYGVNGLKDANEVLSRWGKIPVFTKSFNKGSSVAEFTEIIKSAKDAGADGIYLYSYADSSSDFLKALEQVKGYNPIIFGPAANAVELWKLAGPLASRLVFASGILYDQNAKTKELNQKIIDKYGRPAPIFASAANAYDSVKLLEAAIKNAGTLDKKTVRDALENVQGAHGVIKTYEKPFSKSDHEGITARDMSLNYWVDGKVVKYPDEDIYNMEIK